MEEQMKEMIDDMFEEYLEGGFDFTTEQSLEEIFKGIFSDAVSMTIEILESADNEEE